MSSRIVTEEFNIIVSRMFKPDKEATQNLTRRVTIEPLTSGFGSAFLFKMTPELLIQVKSPKSAVIKFGPREDIAVEARNYDRFVEWFLTVDQTVRRIQHEEFNNFGAILYSFPREVTSGYKTFADYVRQESVEKSRDILERMFAPTNKHWLAVDASRYVGSKDQTFQWYYLRKVLRSSPYDMQNEYFDHQYLRASENRSRKLRGVLQKDNFDALVEASEEKLTFPCISTSVPNPVKYLSRPLFDTIPMSIVHGDLHSNNILISEDNRYFLLDFFYTSFGHVYRDFVQLELSLRYDIFLSRQLEKSERLMVLDREYETNNATVLGELYQNDVKGLKLLLRLEKAIIKQSVHGQEQKDPAIIENDRTIKALELICAIRRLAFANFPSSRKSYYQALIFCAVKTLKYWYPLNVRSYFLLVAGEYVRLLDDGAIQ
jgi:hypothetical protein